MTPRLSTYLSTFFGAAMLTLCVSCGPSDAGITTQVKAKIDADRNLTSKSMQVDTKKGVVTLTGSAASDAERKRAEQLARTTDGVKDVVDSMALNPDLAPGPTPAGAAGAPSAPTPSGDPTTPAPSTTAAPGN